MSILRVSLDLERPWNAETKKAVILLLTWSKVVGISYDTPDSLDQADAESPPSDSRLSHTLGTFACHGK